MKSILMKLLKLYIKFFGRNVILCFHSVGKKGLSKKKFMEQINTLESIGYCFPNPESLPNLPKNKSVIITFDDGYRDNLEIVESFLKPKKIKPIIFVVTEFLESKITNNEEHGLKNIPHFTFEAAINFKNDIFFGYHTACHDNLYETNLDSSFIEKFIDGDMKFSDLVESNQKKYFAYPFGYIPKDKVKFQQLLKELNYSYSFTTRWGKVCDSKHYMNRVVIGDNDDALKCLLKISGILDLYSRFKWRGSMYEQA